MGIASIEKLAFWKKAAVIQPLGVFVCQDKLVVCQLKTSLSEQASVEDETTSESSPTVSPGSPPLEFTTSDFTSTSTTPESSVASGASATQKGVTRELEQGKALYSFQTFEFKNNWQNVLSAIASAYGPAKIHFVLSATFYQLLSVDKPNIEPEELPQALLWSIKDMVTQPVQELQIDHFEAPIENNTKLNVVVADKAWLSELATIAQSLQIDIAGISIEELALANLFSANIQQARLVVSHLNEQELLLTVVKGGELYMQRRVRGFNKLDQLTGEDLAFGVADNLSLELQRSMDYFDSQLRQAPVTSIELIVGGDSRKLADLVTENFNQDVNIIDHGEVDELFAKLAFAEFARQQGEGLVATVQEAKS